MIDWIAKWFVTSDFILNEDSSVEMTSCSLRNNICFACMANFFNRLYTIYSMKYKMIYFVTDKKYFFSLGVIMLNFFFIQISFQHVHIPIITTIHAKVGIDTLIFYKKTFFYTHRANLISRFEWCQIKIDSHYLDVFLPFSMYGRMILQVTTDTKQCEKEIYLIHFLLA